VSQQNVVPFEGRRAMARRGSPDKASSSDPIELGCPDCGAPLSPEGDSQARRELCERCGATVDLAIDDGRTAGARPE